MFSFEDNRTPAERDRDLKESIKRQANETLAVSVLRNLKPFLESAGVSVGIPMKDIFAAKVGLEIDGVVYKLSLSVDHEV